MAKRSRPDGILELAVACLASNYVAKPRASELRIKSLKPLGHIFEFATLRIRLSEKGSRFRPRKAACPSSKFDKAQHLMQGDN